MLSYELAKMLLERPNLPVATHAMNHTYASLGHAETHGELRIGLWSHYTGDHVIIGDISGYPVLEKEEDEQITVPDSGAD